MFSRSLTFALSAFIALAMLSFISFESVNAQERNREATPTPETERKQRESATAQPNDRATPTPQNETRDRTNREPATAQPNDRPLLPEKPTPQAERRELKKPEASNAKPTDRSVSSEEPTPITIFLEQKISVGHDKNSDRSSATMNQDIQVRHTVEMATDNLKNNQVAGEQPEKSTLSDDRQSSADCAMNSGGQSSFNIFGLLLSPVMLRLLSRIRNTYQKTFQRTAKNINP
tara:strand:+ start:1036 stop:1731 length:696 start_codon:yes stop_codon:yes gene_type:complete